MRHQILFAMLLFGGAALAQGNTKIITSDIKNFWVAFDSLATAKNKSDSVRIIQSLYLDKASSPFRKFVRKRNFTATEYIALIARYPKFWASIRPVTERIEGRKAEILEVLQKLGKTLPHFKSPDVCFAIGCMRTGGTTSKGLILIGAEIAASDSSVNKSELRGWLKSVIGNNGDIVAMVAHETIHTQQSGFPVNEIFVLAKKRKLRLLNMAITEGSCDYITQQTLGLNINAHIHSYGEARYCELAESFKTDCKEKPFDYSNWLYNGNDAQSRPADLGYFLGYKITEAYFKHSSNKTRAYKTILKRGKYKKVYRKSGFERVLCK